MKQMHLALYFDFRHFSPISLSEVSESERDVDESTARVRYHFHVGHWPWGDKSLKSFSRLVGKYLVPPQPREMSGKWPFEQKRVVFEHFVIGTDERGEPISHTSDPSRLSDYFGGNPGAPHYLTPVFFRKEVLAKYYVNPTRYVVEDGYLRCKGLWGISIDNNHPSHVAVYLGDLGRDLSHKEQLYWKSFNVPPVGTISHSSFSRDFLAEFAPPERPDLVFKSHLRRFSKSWRERFGWDLFLPLSEGDQHLLSTLRIPLADDQSEFDTQILGLTKVIIDSINEAELTRHIAPGAQEERGISKLGRYLDQRRALNSQSHIKLLRAIQALRSTGVGHRKGKNYREAAAAVGVGTKSLPQVFEDILARCVAMLDDLTNHFLPKE